MPPCTLLLICLALLPAADAPKPPRPQVVLATSLGIAPGKTTRIILRGLNLDAVTEVRLHDPKGSARLLRKGTTAVPNQQDPNKIGNTEVEAELSLSADYPGQTVPVAVITPGGESLPLRLRVDRTAIVAEKEPNNGFREAQPLTPDAEVQGAIAQPQDVDLFRFAGKKGEKVVLEVFAARHGSPLDALLTVYDAHGQILATCDDLDGSTDARLEMTLPRTGTYYVSVMDANDQGTAFHLYRLSLRHKSE